MSLSVTVLVLKGCTPLASIGPLEILLKAGELHAQATGGVSGSPFFQARLVAVGRNPVLTPSGYPVHCHTSIEKVRRTDLVIVPALDGDVPSQLEDNRACVPWLRRMHERGADIASVCTGAFVLAEAGLLDGKTATTHWSAQSLFASRYPGTRLLPEQIVVDHGRICTSGGATSFLTLSVYLVEKYCGPEAARLTCKVFLIDMNKGPQNAYAIFSGQKNHPDKPILEAQLSIERETDRELSVSELATRAAMSPRNFIRRFKSATGNTPIEYIQRVRIESAKHALESGGEPVEAIAAGIGYEDLGSFRRVFKRQTGLTPTEYRKRYRYYQAS